MLGWLRKLADQALRRENRLLRLRLEMRTEELKHTAELYAGLRLWLEAHVGAANNAAKMFGKTPQE